MSEAEVSDQAVHQPTTIVESAVDRNECFSRDLAGKKGNSPSIEESALPALESNFEAAESLRGAGLSRKYANPLHIVE
jgi:hypothetical protein